MPKLLVCDKNGDIQSLLSRRFEKGEISIDSVPHVATVLDEVQRDPCDIIVWDADVSKSERAKGVETLEVLSRSAPQTQIIIVSWDKRDPASASIKNENYQFIRRPIDANKLCALVKLALERRPSSQRMLSCPEVRIPIEFEGMLAISLPMREVFQRILEAASTDVSVFITGETGTGKDLVAAAIHKRSKRKEKPYIPVNTGAMAPELIASELFGHEKGAYTGASETRQGLFERADHGTIFLDEISTMNEKAQVSLLRVLETKTVCRVGGTKDIAVDARVITATNENIEEAVKEKHFREDLYYRLDVFRIHVPPLRDRPGAVTFFTDHYVTLFNAAYNKRVRVVSRETYRCLRRYPWPGNVRELRNVIQRAVLMAEGKELTPDLIPERIREAAKLDAGQGTFPIRLGMTLEAAEKELIRITLASTDGNKKTAASILGISRRALYNKLNRFGLL
ncbi:MAG: sigma-54-dependent Fis family transcriptional regulator [Deltaproteobacteria bacterium]|nr:sigma-54-dependent Fis family transcriptional regulator [Deltaproteobacteria bacterium]